MRARFLFATLVAASLVASLPGEAVAQVRADSVRADSVRADSARADSARVRRVRADSLRAVPVAFASALPVMTVEARRDRIAAPTARLTRLTAADVTASGARSVADLLAARSGLFVRRYGATGLATLSARGTSSQQTLVLVDGLRVADPQTGQVDLATLPSVLLESVEVQHGPGAARHGSGGLGAVVHLRTLAPTTDLRARASGGAGALGERRGAVMASGGTGAVAAVVAAHAYTVENDFAYVNESLFPVETVRREGAGMDAQTLFGRVALEAGPHEVQATAWVNRTRRGLPGPSNAAPPEAEQEDALARLALDGTLALGDAATLRAAMQGQRTAVRYANPATGARRATEATRLAAQADVGASVGARWHVVAGGEGVFERASLRGGVRQRTTAAFAQGTGRYGRLAVYPAVRLDVQTLDASAFAPGPLDADAPQGVTRAAAASPRVGLTWRPVPRVAGLTLKAQGARAFRFPTFNERFYQPGGNPGLEPESGWSLEAGAALAAGSARAQAEAEATVFGAWLDDQIVWRPSVVEAGLQVWRPANVGRVRTRGVEVSAEGALRLADHLRVAGGALLTLTDAQNRANPLSPAFGQQLRYVPVRQTKAWAAATWRALTLDVQMQAVGRRYISSDESVALAPYEVVDVQARYRLDVGAGALTLGLRLDNALDARYDIIRLYPMPPRTLSARLAYALGP
jgi:iron complex outermembrane receptor protein